MINGTYQCEISISRGQARKDGTLALETGCDHLLL